MAENPAVGGKGNLACGPVFSTLTCRLLFLFVQKAVLTAALLFHSSAERKQDTIVSCAVKDITCVRNVLGRSEHLPLYGN